MHFVKGKNINYMAQVPISLQKLNLKTFLFVIVQIQKLNQLLFL